jgi:hypothetical protein
MDPLTFNQQLALMLIDKFAIGLVILIVVFIGQRMLEAYKGKQVLWAEISKERVKHIADEWKEMNTWDSIVGNLFRRLHLILVQHLPYPVTTNPEMKAERPTLADTAKLLAVWQNQTIPEQLSAMCEKELRPLIDESMKQAEVVNAAVQDNRFWLGKELYNHCEQFRIILHNICVAFDAKEFGELAARADELDAYREDVLTTLRRIK